MQDNLLLFDIGNTTMKVGVFVGGVRRQYTLPTDAGQTADSLGLNLLLRLGLLAHGALSLTLSRSALRLRLGARRHLIAEPLDLAEVVVGRALSRLEIAVRLQCGLGDGADFGHLHRLSLLLAKLLARCHGRAAQLVVLH